ncbi:hypothetical protein H310_11605 [Aphanomyces invadans]|uniref:DUF4203 domain-containing protein n=1 Tax=Aphanomyces invadans TaxID=157072 RepID=A0A024TNR5_9STRA|nr:hypothetical protein H310_11605 [Aphanomyces invadans]ETV94962.1 hypothetical protein H310_11605 [Aphanomyces invadans]|eukprot:XP_008876553.1 hypothetical protein H310_11605 [Aphanomyces invadans]
MLMEKVETAELVLTILFGLVTVSYGYNVIQFVMVVFSIMGFLAVARSYGVERMATFYIALLYFVAFFIVLPYVPLRYHEMVYLIAKFALHIGALAWTIQIVFNFMPEFYVASMLISVIISVWIWGFQRHTSRVCLIFSTSLLGSLVLADAIRDWSRQDNIAVVASDGMHVGIIVFFTLVGLYFQTKGSVEPVERHGTFEVAERPSVAATELSETDFPSTPHTPTSDFVTVPYVEVIVHRDAQARTPFMFVSSIADEAEVAVEVPPTKPAAPSTSSTVL